MIPTRAFFLVAILMLTAVPLAAAEVPSEALLQDAASYAEQFGVGLDEAVRRLQLQRVVGDLDAAVSAEERDAFAGLWIEHTPRYRVVARFTNRAAEARFQARVARGPLAGLVETRSARLSLAQLEQQQAEIKAHLTRAGENYNSDVNVFENRVELYATDPARVKRIVAAEGASVLEGVRFHEVERIGRRETLTGGMATGNLCTFGFAVTTLQGELGITTAGHCSNQQSYNGIDLPHRNGRDYEYWDIQWHSTCDLVDVTNLIQTAYGPRRITGTRSRSQQPIGQYQCKYGRTTQQTCGKLTSKSFDPGISYNATFMRVEADEQAIEQNMSSPGDSGGPWFVENLALGSHAQDHPADDRDAIYMAINYLDDLGAHVLLVDPGPGCNSTPWAYFTYSNSFATTYSFDASGSGDFDGTIVSYFWDFGDGTTATTTTPYVTHSFDGGGTYNVTLIVTDNDGDFSGFNDIITTSCGGPGEPHCFE